MNYELVDGVIIRPREHINRAEGKVLRCPCCGCITLERGVGGYEDGLQCVSCRTAFKILILNEESEHDDEADVALWKEHDAYCKALPAGQTPYNFYIWLEYGKPIHGRVECILQDEKDYQDYVESLPAADLRISLPEWLDVTKPYSPTEPRPSENPSS